MKVSFRLHYLENLTRKFLNHIYFTSIEYITKLLIPLKYVVSNLTLLRVLLLLKHQRNSKLAFTQKSPPKTIIK